MNKIIKKTVETMADIREAHKGLQAVLVAASIDSKWAGKLGVVLSVSDFITNKYQNYLYHNINPDFQKENTKFAYCNGPKDWNHFSKVDNINFHLFSLFEEKFSSNVDLIQFGESYFIGEIKTEKINIKYSKTIEYSEIRYSFSIENYSEYLKEIRIIFRETYGNHIINESDGSLSIDNRKIYENSLAPKIINEIEIFQNKELTRSYLLYGPPGTGKTNLALNIAEKFGSLYIANTASWLRQDAGIRKNLLEFLDYQVIILDDLDHAKNDYAALFSWMQWLRSIGKIVIATCNSFDSFPQALLRPGRFDRLIEIKRLDDPAIMAMVEGDLEVFEMIKEQPAACINEFMQRLKAFGKEEAILQKDEIFERVKLYLEQ